LRKVYTSLANNPTVAVENVNFGLEYGECFAILGANGAGKTTTFKCMTSELQPTEGKIIIEGFNV
jgi:ATP-binding cassette subfamily A (ABC1) protein 3